MKTKSTIFLLALTLTLLIAVAAKHDLARESQRRQDINKLCAESQFIREQADYECLIARGEYAKARQVPHHKF